MPNLVVALKEEIRRLARKEIRAQISATKRATVLHRREIAKLKRLVAQQDKKLRDLATQGAETRAESDGDNPLEGRRFAARSVRSQRRRLRLSAQAFAKLIGVSAQTVYHWEQGKSRPRRSQLAGLVAVRQLGKREARAQLDAQRAEARRRTATKGQRVRKPR